MKKVFLGILWWIWQLTWGGLMTIPGLIVTGFCIVLLKGKPHKNGFSYIVEIGNDWGGLELGAVALCGRYSESSPYWFEHTRKHEFGHAIQQLIFGPFQIFVVWIPSAIRYWYQRIAVSRGKIFSPDWYDSIWFEKTATKWGSAWVEKIEKIN